MHPAPAAHMRYACQIGRGGDVLKPRRRKQLRARRRLIKTMFQQQPTARRQMRRRAGDYPAKREQGVGVAIVGSRPGKLLF